MTILKKCVATVFAAIAALGVGSATAQDVMVVYDASGSMWGQIDGVTKIEIARDVMGDLVDQWSDDTSLGLIAYGHRREGDCGDIETLIEPAPVDPAGFMETVNAINPLGKTPLSAAVEQAAEVLVYRENPATVVLISDGIENCAADPCALSSELEQRGIDFTAHVIGFDVSSDQYEELACIAENTGGIFVPASDAGELADALNEVKAVIETAPAPEPEPQPEPAPEPEPEVDPVTVTAPESVVVGSRFTVSWTPTLAPDDFLTIVEADAEEGAYDDYVYTREETEGELRAPAEPGLYQVRYVFDETDETAGFAPVEVIDGNVTVSAPETAIVGSDFTVSWTNAIDANDYVTVVAAGAEEGTYGDYQRVRDRDDETLTSPSEPGLYEVRYILEQGDRTMAVSALEVTEAAITVSAPKQVTTGARFDVSWTGAANGNDYVTIVPVDADEGTYGDYQRVRDNEEDTLTAPGQPGLYEVRYVLEEGDRTMAATTVEVVSADVTVSAPEEAVTGAEFEVSWTGAVNPQDYVTIVPMGADEGTYGDYQRVSDVETETLTAPAAPGLYEVRYVLEEDQSTLASQPIEVVEPEVTVSAPSEVTTGAQFEVSWTGTVNSNDYVTIVEAGAEEGTYGEYQRVRDAESDTLTAPGQPGLYEVRYVLEEGGRTMASTPVEVTQTQVTIEGPDKVRVGEDVPVNWSLTINPNDYIAILPAGAEAGELSNNYLRARENTETTLKAPMEPGLYEVRYILAQGQMMLASSPLEVVNADAAIDKGAGLSVPESGAAGSTITVTWTADVEGARVAFARADQADFTWIEVQAVSADKAAKFKLPDEPGSYEVRFLDVPNQAVLGRAIILVE